jgi:hypothetical protein
MKSMKHAKMPSRSFAGWFMDRVGRKDAVIVGMVRDLQEIGHSVMESISTKLFHLPTTTYSTQKKLTPQARTSNNSLESAY